MSMEGIVIWIISASMYGAFMYGVHKMEKWREKDGN